jgi:HlyD family secretion protein
VRLEDDEFKVRVAQQQGLLENAQAKLAELEAGSRPEEIGEAKAMLDASKAQLANAQSNLDRLKKLDQDRNVSRQEIDDAETLLRSRQAQVDAQQHRVDLVVAGPRKEQIAAAKATVHQLEGSLAQAQLDLDNTIIRAPMDATVLSRNVEVGEFVTTGFVGDRGAKGYVLSIADLNDLRVDLDIDQNSFAKVQSHQSCWITTDAYPDRRYDGTVDLISPEANRQKATIQVRVKVLHPDELLKPDMNATVYFRSVGKASATQEKPLIRVPKAALREGGAVFVVADGRAVRRSITIGQSSATGEVQVRQGLVGGEDLIVDAPSTLQNGDRVSIREHGN